MGVARVQGRDGGRATKAAAPEIAARRYQKAHGPEADGAVGPSTPNGDSTFEPAKKKPAAPVAATHFATTAKAGKYEKIALKKQGQEFVDRARQIADKIGVPPECLFAMMENESGMDPSMPNQGGSGAVGLIQFMPETASGLGTTPEALQKMNALKQLDYVEKYFKPFKGKLHSGADLYLVALYPVALGRGDDFVLGSERKDNPNFAKKVAAQNRPADLNHDGKLTKGEFYEYYRRRFPDLP